MEPLSILKCCGNFLILPPNNENPVFRTTSEHMFQNNLFYSKFSIGIVPGLQSSSTWWMGSMTVTCSRSFSAKSSLRKHVRRQNLLYITYICPNYRKDLTFRLYRELILPADLPAIQVFISPDLSHLPAA